MTKAQKSWVKNKDMPKFKIGDQVWLEGCHLPTNQPTTKLAPRRHGPFSIVQVMSPVNYHLQLPTQWSIYLVFHIDLLTPYHETPKHGPNYQCPLPDLVDSTEEYEVEKILDSCKFSKKCKLQIWSSGRVTQTQRTSGSIRMMSLLTKPCRNSNNQTLLQKCI